MSIQTSMNSQFDAIELITQRTLISQRNSELLTERAAQFGLLLDDISIIRYDKKESRTHLSFRPEFTSAVELKQGAQQDVGKQRFLVEKVSSQVATAHFQLVLSRDQGFSGRRLFTVVPLINQYPIGSILLENPYYGLRKPPDQSRSSLLYVIDLYIMGEVLALETLMLLHWCQKMRLTSATLHGFSLGGHMASLAFTKWSDPLSRQFYENKIVLDLIKDMMRLVMDELTSSYNYSCSVQSNISNAMFIACTHDGYVLRDGIPHMNDVMLLLKCYNDKNQM
ncbi:unnamed protein product [Rotaria sordida]|uniref:Uncharacterized protein n=1 Tax=Rotaria sordida TaxID=392033 RepID=A0A815C1V7_9BILA|nr:unnamed protein product [Rotaria sordida]CAF1556518.1 unnamed protein product [Rotaria sordida]